MKLVIVAVLAVVALAVAAPQNRPSNDESGALILKSDFDQQPHGPYEFGFQTDNKIQRDEKSELKQVVDEENKPQDVLTVRGSYSYVDPEGKEHVVNYYADETGFHAESEDIPKQRR